MGFIADKDGNRNCWNDHRNAQYLELHNPTGVFYQPKQNVEVIGYPWVFKSFQRKFHAQLNL